MTLDDKLREILKFHIASRGQSYSVPITKSLIAQIKQAFADKGYLPYKYFYDIPKDKRKDMEWWSKTPTIMTGQEWYERFMGNIPAGWILEEQLIEAAKKASGL